MNIPPSPWTPPEGVKRHAGAPIKQEMDFFAAPPPEIGPVITAESNLTDHSDAVPIFHRIGAGLLIGMVITAILWLALHLFSVRLPLALFAILAVGVAVLVFAFLGFRGSCSYVGNQGIAEITLTGKRSALPNVNMLTFEKAAHLYANQTRQYKKGRYRGTVYRYQWTRPNAPDYIISGEYHSEKGTPGASDRWHFAKSAEAAWTDYLLKFVNQDIQQRGYVEFPMSGNPKMVRVGSGFLEFVTQQGETQRADVTEMQDIKLDTGHFQFKHQDSRWWSGKGFYGFSYDTMPNAKLFLLCLHQLTHISFS